MSDFTKMSNEDLILRLECSASDYAVEAGSRLSALTTWHPASEPPEDGRYRWVATFGGFEKGYYDPDNKKWMVYESRPITARARWYDDVRVIAYLDYYRPPLDLPEWREPEPK